MLPSCSSLCYFSAAISLLIETFSADQVFGSVFTSDGKIREIPAFFIIFLISILYVIIWGYFVFLTNSLRIRFAKDFRQLRTPILAHFIKIFGTFGVFIFLGVGLIIQNELIIVQALLLGLLFLYAIVLYINVSSNSMLNSIQRLPITKNWLESLQARVLFWLGILMLIRLLFFDLSSITDFLSFLIQLLTLPALVELLEFIQSIFTYISDWMTSILALLYLDFLSPIVSLISTIKSLLVKILVYSMILLLQMDLATQDFSVSEAIATAGVSKEALEATSVEAGYQITDRIGTMVYQDLVEKSYFPDYHKVLASGRFWRMALSILIIFFLEGILILTDIELNTSFKLFMDFFIAFAVWCSVIFLSLKTRRRIGRFKKSRKYEVKLK